MRLSPCIDIQTKTVICIQCNVSIYSKSRSIILPFDWYQTVLLDDRGTCVCVNTLPKVVKLYVKWNELE